MPRQINYENYELPTEGIFLKLEQGNTRLRLLTPPHEVILHEVNDQGKWGTVPCEGEGCELCKKGAKLRFRFAYVVLNRKDDKVYVLEVGRSIFKQIMAYATNEEYGDPTSYDMTFNKEGEKLSTTYTVIASPKKEPLTKEEKELVKEAIKEVNIEKAYEKST